MDETRGGSFSANRCRAWGPLWIRMTRRRERRREREPSGVAPAHRITQRRAVARALANEIFDLFGRRAEERELHSVQRLAAAIVTAAPVDQGRRSMELVGLLVLVLQERSKISICGGLRNGAALCGSVSRRDVPRFAFDQAVAAAGHPNPQRPQGLAPVR